MSRSRCAALLALLLGVSSLIGPAGAEIYRWVDEGGQVHFTDNYAAVPPAYRDRVQSRPSAPPAETPPLPSPPSRPKRGGRAASPSRPLSGRSARVVAVIDGDTILIDGGQKVRYAGVNTPESRHPEKLPEYCGREAFEVNRRLVAGKTVRLEFDAQPRDKYGRLLAYVYADNRFINAELVRLGYAQVSTYRENQRHYQQFLRLQREAITARRGLWGGCMDPPAPPSPTKPKSGAAQKGR